MSGKRIIDSVLKLVRTRYSLTQDAIDFARDIVRVLDHFVNPFKR